MVLSLLCFVDAVDAVCTPNFKGVVDLFTDNVTSGKTIYSKYDMFLCYFTKKERFGSIKLGYRCHFLLKFMY